MLDNKTYPVIKIDADYFMVEDMAILSGMYAKQNEYAIIFFDAMPTLQFIVNEKKHGYGYKVLASTKKIGLPLLDNSLFFDASTLDINPQSVEVEHVLREDFSYPLRKNNGYIKVSKVNY